MTTEMDKAVLSLTEKYLKAHVPGESFDQFCKNLKDQDLGNPTVVRKLETIYHMLIVIEAARNTRGGNLPSYVFDIYAICQETWQGLVHFVAREDLDRDLVMVETKFPYKSKWLNR